MYTIIDNISNEIIIDNSRFVTLLYKVYNTHDIDQYLENVKKLYKDATHYCYGYIIDNKIKFSDDGEPSSTAGTPIIEVLKKRKLNYVLAIVVRYFGGIKLGANGLIRAYSSSVSKCLDKSNLVMLVKGYNVNITFKYEESKNIDYLLRNIKINSKEYLEFIQYNMDIPISFIDILENHNIKYEIMKEIYIEKRL